MTKTWYFLLIFLLLSVCQSTVGKGGAVEPTPRQLGVSRNLIRSGEALTVQWSGMPGNPVYRKFNPSQAPIMALALSSGHLAGSLLYDNASTVLAQKLAQITGVGEVEVSGSSLPAVRVQLNPGMLAHYGVALDEVRAAISSVNASVPLGVLESDSHRWQLATSETLRQAADYQNLIIKYINGAPIRLSDVALVTDSTENRYSAGFHNEKSAVILQISRRTGANIVETIDAIYQQMPLLRGSRRNNSPCHQMHSQEVTGGMGQNHGFSPHHIRDTSDGTPAADSNHEAPRVLAQL